jgi:hypothetical protein
MTHSLHRSGDIESLKKDFVWFMYQTKGVNDKDIKPKALEFIAAAEAFGSENWGDVKTGPKTRVPSRKSKTRSRTNRVCAASLRGATRSSDF